MVDYYARVGGVREGKKFDYYIMILILVVLYLQMTGFLKKPNF